MIKDIPTPLDYQKLGFNCLIQSYKNIYQIDSEGQIPGVPREDIWKYHTVVLNTSIVLLHQGIELLLKSEISQKSPLLLIDQKRGEWKTLPNKGDSNFTDLYTYSGNELIKTFYATIDPTTIADGFANHFEEIRVIRNKIVHGISNEEINPEKAVKLILWTFTYIKGKDSFWNALQNNFNQHPGHEVGDEYLELAEIQFYHHLDYLDYILGTGELNNHFSVNLEARRYYCPDCTSADAYQPTAEGEIEYVTSKWAFLTPNEPTADRVTCLVCHDEFPVERIKCNGETGKPCVGNVIYTEQEEEIDEDDGTIYEEAEKICLTCFDLQKND